MIDFNKNATVKDVINTIKQDTFALKAATVSLSDAEVFVRAHFSMLSMHNLKLTKSEVNAYDISYSDRYKKVIVGPVPLTITEFSAFAILCATSFLENAKVGVVVDYCNSIVEELFHEDEALLNVRLELIKMFERIYPL